jgi:hypothetical protein
VGRHGKQIAAIQIINSMVNNYIATLPNRHPGGQAMKDVKKTSKYSSSSSLTNTFFKDK